MKTPVLFLMCAGAAIAQPEIRGFPAELAKAQHAFEKRLHASADALKIRAYMQEMSREPHHAGSPGSRAVAEYAAKLFREWGYETRIEEFEALLPYPTRRMLEMTAPVRFRAKLEEPGVAADADSKDKGQLPTYNAYSASGDVTGQLVYVNYGMQEDYAELKKLGIDLKGKIAIARYGKGWRGMKPKLAAEAGAIGCLIYSDPRDDGHFQGDMFPKGAYRPPAGVQRGSVLDMPLYVGDPLSPGWVSEKGSKRLQRSEARNLLTIPVLPISSEDAAPLLAQLTSGPVAPEAWRGALPITYHLGPGPATVRLALDFDWTTKPGYQPIAVMRGSESPDEWIVYGNHHDAWVNGANDPVSGAAALLETARTLSELRKSGWQPKRTIVFALWDAEEFGLVGSTEWVEKHRTELQAKTVAYLNTDSSGRGRLSVGGSPTLESFFTEILRDAPAPGGASESLLAATVKPETPEGKPRDFQLTPMGAGSDYVAFLHHAGIASLNAGFGGPESFGVYHSIYDSFYWYANFSDKDFSHGRSLAQVMGSTIARLAGASVLPFEFGRLSSAVRRYVSDLPDGVKNVKLDAVDSELKAIDAAAAGYEGELKRVLAKGAPAEKLAAVNRVLYRSERALLEEAGLPRRPWYKYLLSAPGVMTGYSAKTLPGIREAIEARQFEEANAEAVKVAAALARVRGRIEEASALLRVL